MHNALSEFFLMIMTVVTNYECECDYIASYNFLNSALVNCVIGLVPDPYRFAIDDRTFDE